MIKADIINRVSEDASITKVKAVEAVEAASAVSVAGSVVAASVAVGSDLAVLVRPCAKIDTALVCTAPRSTVGEGASGLRPRTPKATAKARARSSTSPRTRRVLLRNIVLLVLLSEESGDFVPFESTLNRPRHRLDVGKAHSCSCPRAKLLQIELTAATITRDHPRPGRLHAHIF